jgi:hypothetical protein
LSYGVTGGAALFAVFLLFFIPTSRPGDGTEDDPRDI